MGLNKLDCARLQELRLSRGNSCAYDPDLPPQLCDLDAAVVLDQPVAVVPACINELWRLDDDLLESDARARCERVYVNVNAGAEAKN